MAFTRAIKAGCLLSLLVLAGCPGNGDDGQGCSDSAQCSAGRVCIDGTCLNQAGDTDGGLIRDLPGGDGVAEEPADAAADPLPGDPGEADCGEECGDASCAADAGCDDPVPDTAGDTPDSAAEADESDPLSALSPECAGFCQALCVFLEECGKNDPTCLDRCGQSPRFQQLSAAACTEGAHVIGLEDCRLWLDCGGRSCAIDEMCLDLFVSYQCAPLCDHTQAQPACASGVSCSDVADAAGSVMSSLGMCWSLF